MCQALFWGDNYEQDRRKPFPYGADIFIEETDNKYN